MSYAFDSMAYDAEQKRHEQATRELAQEGVREPTQAQLTAKLTEIARRAPGNPQPHPNFDPGLRD